MWHPYWIILAASTNNPALQSGLKNNSKIKNLNFFIDIYENRNQSSSNFQIENNSINYMEKNISYKIFTEKDKENLKCYDKMKEKYGKHCKNCQGSKKYKHFSNYIFHQAKRKSKYYAQLFSDKCIKLYFNNYKRQYVLNNNKKILQKAKKKCTHDNYTINKNIIISLKKNNNHNYKNNNYNIDENILITMAKSGNNNNNDNGSASEHDIRKREANLDLDYLDNHNNSSKKKTTDYFRDQNQLSDNYLNNGTYSKMNFHNNQKSSLEKSAKNSSDLLNYIIPESGKLEGNIIDNKRVSNKIIQSNSDSIISSSQDVPQLIHDQASLPVSLEANNFSAPITQRNISYISNIWQNSSNSNSSLSTVVDQSPQPSSPSVYVPNLHVVDYEELNLQLSDSVCSHLGHVFTVHKSKLLAMKNHDDVICRARVRMYLFFFKFIFTCFFIF